jgi:hypothetical protein
VINRVSKPLLIIKQKTKNTKTKENIIKNHQKQKKISSKISKNIKKKLN